MTLYLCRHLYLYLYDSALHSNYYMCAPPTPIHTQDQNRGNEGAAPLHPPPPPKHTYTRARTLLVNCVAPSAYSILSTMASRSSMLRLGASGLSLATFRTSSKPIVSSAPPKVFAKHGP